MNIKLIDLRKYQAEGLTPNKDSKRKTLKDILNKSIVIENINENICILTGLKHLPLDECIAKIKEVNKNTVDIKIEGELTNYYFETSLYYSLNKDIYLLECRLFEGKEGQMINAYLEIFDNDLNILNECIDDVWSYTDWVEME